jgi:dTDP-4-amino-4,6-dideoxygalactose transaminase
MNTIPFNKTYITGNELKYIAEVISSGKLSGDGPFSKRCQQYLEDKYGFKKCLLTTSCTDALEMAAILLNIQPNDEVIIPSYTFVSTANAFVLRGAKIIFADSEEHSPNIDASKIESLITPQTKAIVVVHYGGIACEMDEIMSIANRYNLFVVEDAAQAIDAFYKGRPLGSIGHLAAFSFHETKNIVSGEGGMLVINDLQFLERAEIIRDKGTNRGMFSRGEVDKYEWTDIGSSFLPSDILAAFLYAQLEQLEEIQSWRKTAWQHYWKALRPLSEADLFQCLPVEDYKQHNANLFCIVTKSETERNDLISWLSENDIASAFHYLSLHKSPFYAARHDGRALFNADKFSGRLLRLPFYSALKPDEIEQVSTQIKLFYGVPIDVEKQ